jgi:hypothetical protein
MAASKSIREALNTLNDELLTAKLTAVRSITSTLTSRLRRLPPRSACLGVFVVVQMVDRLERASEALEVLLRQRHCQCEDMENPSPGPVSRGLGTPQARKGVAEEGTRPGHPQDNQRSDGRRPPLFFRVHCTLCRSPILPRHQDLNFSSRLTPPWSAHIIQVP